MNFNKTVVTNGKISQVNVADLLDITDPKQVKQFNELRKQNFKKSFTPTTNSFTVTLLRLHFSYPPTYTKTFMI